MKKKFIVILFLFFSFKVGLAQKASILLYTNRYYNDIYIQNPNSSYGVGLNFKIFKKFEGGFEFSWLKMKRYEEGFGRTVNNKYVYYTVNINESYFIPEIYAKYNVFELKKLRLDISIGDQMMQRYFRSVEGVFDGINSSYEIRENDLINNSLKLSLIARYKIIEQLEIQIQPFYLKNVKNIDLDRSNYGFQLGVRYNLYW
jgi:hypothetical protein